MEKLEVKYIYIKFLKIYFKKIDLADRVFVGGKQAPSVGKLHSDGKSDKCSVQQVEGGVV